MTARDVVNLLNQTIKQHGSAKAVATRMGLSQQYLCDVRKGRREVSDRLASMLGLRRIVTFEPIGKRR